MAVIWMGTGRFGVPWTPAAITTAVWLDAADSSTITTVSSAVSQWNDKSGNNRHFTQTTASKQPTVNSAFINNNNTILFSPLNTSNSEIKELTASSYVASRGSIFIVLRPGAAQQANASVFQSRASGLEGFRAGVVPNNQNTVTTSIANSVGRINGTEISTFSASALFHTYSANQTLILGAVYPAASSVTVQWGVGRDLSPNPDGRGFVGNVAEIVVLAQIDVLTTHQRIEGYLAHKWGITSNLPFDHPYKNTAPTL
jgi:hypothetical protein